MKNKPITRPLDENGRISIPAEMRAALDWGPGDRMEIEIAGDTVKLSKQVPGCYICGENNDLVRVFSKKMCLSCRQSAARTLSR